MESELGDQTVVECFENRQSPLIGQRILRVPKIGGEQLGAAFLEGKYDGKAVRGMERLAY